MVCAFCKINFDRKFKKYCSKKCYGKGRIGTKRPDVVLRNKTNNPIHYDGAKQKMIQVKTGLKQSPEHIEKRVSKIKKLYEDDPDRRMRQVKSMHEKYTSKIPPGWRKMRLKALERDKYTCQNCYDNSKRVVVHHKDHQGRSLKFKKDMNNDLGNLITLCYGCHNTIHMWQVRKAHKT